MGKIKVVLWDIDGTLLNFKAAEKAAIRKCFEVCELGECSDEMIMAYSEINHKYWKMLECGEMSKQEILVGRFREFFEAEGLDVSKAEAFNNEYQVRLGDTICFEEHALDVILELKGTVLQCAVTNGTKVAQTKKLANSGLDLLLDHVFISDVIGVEKPMQGFFDAVWESIGTFEKDEVLIVGDSLTSDMRGGENAGVLTCWYNPNNADNDLGISIDYEIHDLKEVLEIIRDAKDTKYEVSSGSI